MASQVLSGSSNVSYTNNTGQNVRIVINYMNTSSTDTLNPIISLSWGGVSVSAVIQVIGRNLAFTRGGANNAISNSTTTSAQALPTELMIAPGQTFTALCGAYNIIIIPEAG